MLSCGGGLEFESVCFSGGKGEQDTAVHLFTEFHAADSRVCADGVAAAQSLHFISLLALNPAKTCLPDYKSKVIDVFWN